ncbi:AAA family ATPase [Nocardia sp. SYP-A9097]|uniref:AAA family ATPase n=1 Tax=Nocardia sp. SYP-A9097 TaxID=2663237 RepID=UPI00129AEF1F|nr:AAA family ATPase [Nocardia sp. SYP-A9097]MRH86859.1 AAA family ATPase [Nocardia sp. SYP-A9097]
MLTVRLMGELEIENDGRPVVLPNSRRARLLLAWLALHPGRHPRSRLAALLWPDVLDTSARANLRSALWALRVSLGEAGPGYLITDPEGVALVGKPLTVDVREFVRLAGEGQSEAAVALCRGELLDGFDDEWVYRERAEHQHRLALALRAQTRQAEARGRADAALVAAQRLLELEPFDEGACRDVMRLLAGRGETNEALQVYASLVRRMRVELDCVPAPETKTLASKLRGPIPVNDSRPIETSTVRTHPMVDRYSELTRLREYWHEARNGHGSVVAVVGEGGIGKTRLCDELQSDAEHVGALVITAAAGPLEVGRPFALWSEVLAELVDDTDDESARLLSVSENARPAVDPRLERSRLFESVVTVIARAARVRPLLIVLDDLHRTDVSSLELAVHVGRRVARMPVLLVLTRRRQPSRPDVEAALGALRACGALRLVLDLAPLSDTGMRNLIRSVAELPPSTVEQITAAAGGSPLLAVEAGLACARGADIIVGLTEAVHAALYRLSPPARRLVELLAVAGREIGRAELLAMRLPEPERAETEALGADLLQIRDGLLGFRHALLAEAVYGDLRDPLRAQLHDEFAELLRRRAGHRDGGSRAAEIAHHLRAAGRDALAVGQLVRAAAAARAVAALPEAVGFLHEATTIDPYDHELFIEIAEVQAWRGLLEESDAAFARALELTAPDDNGALISAWLRRGRWLRGGICHPRESRRSYCSALDVLDRDSVADPAARLEALAGLAWAEAVAGDPARCNELLLELTRLLGRTVPSDLLVHDIGVARAHALLRAGRFEDSYAPLIAAAAAAGRSGRPEMGYSCLINATSAAACVGDFDRALDFAERCLALVEPNGLLRLTIYTYSARATILRRLGRFDEAETACRLEADLADRIGRPDLEGLACHDRGLLALARNDPVRAAAHLARALELHAPVSRPHTRLWRAEALTLATRFDDAADELSATAEEPITPGDFPDMLQARVDRIHGLIATADGNYPRAHTHLTAALSAWQRQAGTDEAGQRYSATIIDLGRPPLSSLPDPQHECAAITTDLAAIGASRGRSSEDAS